MREELQEGHLHLTISGTFQSDKYPWCHAGFVPLKLTDQDARLVLRVYAQLRGRIDANFGHDLVAAIMNEEAKITE